MKKFKKILCVLIFLLLIAVQTSSIFAFTDLTENHQNYSAIKYLEEKGIIQGYEDGTVKPDKAINRAEALKVILESSNAYNAQLTTENQSNNTTFESNISTLNSQFLDLSESDWFYEYVQTAVDQNLIQGYPDKTFKPENTISLAEALKISLLAFEFSVTEKTENQQWYEPYTNFALEKNFILLQIDGLLHPEKELTRGDLFEIIYRIAYIKENNLENFDISLNWPKLEMAKLNFQLKYPNDWTLIEKTNEIIIWQKDTTNSQIYYQNLSQLSAYLKIVLIENEENLTKEKLFGDLEKIYCTNNCKQDLNTEIPNLIRTFENNDTYSQEQYLYLPNNKILILFIEFGKGSLQNQFLEEINKIIASLTYVKEGTVDSSNLDEIISKANQNIQIDGKGQETLNLFSDLIIIETDPIGVGAGVPVDYYYSKQANITLKYLRSPYDTILDIETGQTSNF
ncbi:hypothetical protein A2335_04490 [Candidatus Peregrinibacteria bacterium RIFOXYB2_FULL_32_7]|nr:MAG: hypothetical protein A2335_04490 [Candidatus Peregrinibacteria bacterium RIFOXYB2_FULL_32_7]